MAHPLRDVTSGDSGEPPPDVVDVPQATPAEAVAAEAAGDDLTLTFRGEKFTIPRGVFGSARLVMAQAAGRDDLTIHQLLSGSPENFDRFLQLIRPGDDFRSVAVEVNEALSLAGQGNSRSSRRSSHGSTTRSKRT